MIFPILNGFGPFVKAPVTWILVLTNVFLFSQNWELSRSARGQMGFWYQDKDFLETQGRLYLQYLGKDQGKLHEVQDRVLVGTLAFQDETFLGQAAARDWAGDQVAIRSWKGELERYISIRDFYPAYAFGVSEGEKSFFSYFSYQFFHEGFMHLFGNLLLVMLIGNFLEKRHSGLVVFGTYLLGGAGSALLYTGILGANGSPLIGASGSLCGLIGFFFYVHFYEKTSLLYFVLPKEGYFGLTRVQTGLWVPWLCVLEDISGWMARPELYVGGVSHFVHLMGFLLGVGLGWGYVALRKIVPEASLTSR